MACYCKKLKHDEDITKTYTSYGIEHRRGELSNNGSSIVKGK